MNKQNFISFTHDPGALGVPEANELSNFLADYPYCTTAQILYAKALHNIQDVGYDRQLKRAASYAPNRQVLYQFLMQQKLIDVIEQVERDTAEVNDTAAPTVEGAEEKTAIPVSDKTTEEPAEKPEMGVLEQEILRAAIDASISLDIDRISHEEVIEEDTTLTTKPKEIRIDVKDGRLSFTQWLNPTESPKPTSRRETFEGIIDRFIQSEPKITPQKPEIFSPSNMAKMSLVEDETFVTETLANIYVKQGNYEKARKAFEQLRLKNPEKSSYFARLLKDLDGLEGIKE